MAKDDYYVVVAHILVFLYRKLKEQIDTDAADYIIPNTKEFPISENYLDYVLGEMQSHQLIRGLTVVRSWGGEVIRTGDLNKLIITQEGIDYLQENSKIQKVLKMIPGAAAVAQLFT